MSTKKFDEIFGFAPKSTIKAGDGLDEGLFPFYTSSPVLSKYINTEQYVNEALIFGTGGSASVHYADEPFSTSTDCIVAIGKRKDENFNTKFIYYYLFGNIHILERGFKGAGLKHISKKYIQNIDIPAYDLDTQNKIVAILDKASALVQKRQRTIDLLDELLRAQFLEMFGDPVKNRKDWPLISLSKIGKYFSGGTPSKNEEKYWNGYFPWVSPKDMKLDYIQDSLDHIAEVVFDETSIKIIPANSVLFVVRGMILAHSFPVAINEVPVAINQDMKAVVLSEEFSPEFILQCLKIMKPWLLVYVSTAGHGTKKLNQDAIDKIHIIAPPIDLQNNFAEKSVKINLLKKNIKKNNNQLKFLQNSLFQRAFSGKLDLDVSIELDALLKEIDLQKSENDLFSITTNEAYLLNLVDRLNNQKFESQDLYDKAKHVAFQLLKIEERLVQEYNEQTQSLKLLVK